MIGKNIPQRKMVVNELQHGKAKVKCKMVITCGKYEILYCTVRNDFLEKILPIIFLFSCGEVCEAE
jgi:hypothetical protein